jgi:hypothetical protein
MPKITQLWGVKSQENRYIAYTTAKTYRAKKNLTAGNLTLRLLTSEQHG